MKTSKLRLVLFSVLCALPGAAWSLDCKKATAAVEKAICAKPELREADARLNEAYRKLMDATDDKEFKEALRFSQRRWIKARAEDFDGEASTTQIWLNPNKGIYVDGPGRDVDLLGQMEERISSLKNIRTRRPTLKTQKWFALKYSGGPFAGYRVGCFMHDPKWGEQHYSCVSEAAFQHGNRVCIAWTEWASGHTTNYYKVADVVQGKLVSRAVCRKGYAPSDEGCPDERSTQDTPWQHPSKYGDSDLSDSKKTRYSFDLTINFHIEDSSDEEKSWPHNCLTEKDFPGPINFPEKDTNPPPTQQ